MRVLVVEDEERLAQNIATILRDNALCAVDTAPDGEEGLFLATSTPYDLIVLDLMLPKLNGLEVLTRLRGEGRNTPVLVLTARDEKEIVVKLLNAGADDYLTKPFDLGEFVARSKALLRRGKGEHSPVIEIGPLSVNTVTRAVEVGGSAIVLTAMEYRVLEYLALRRPALVSKEELLEHLYDYNWEKFGNVIEVYISGLRRKIEGLAGQRLIHTVRGLGYTLRSEGEAPGSASGQ
jgi:two-component system response regulator PhoP